MFQIMPGQKHVIYFLDNFFINFAPLPVPLHILLHAPSGQGTLLSLYFTSKACQSYSSTCMLDSSLPEKYIKSITQVVNPDDFRLSS